MNQPVGGFLLRASHHRGLHARFVAAMASIAKLD